MKGKLTFLIYCAAFLCGISIGLYIVRSNDVKRDKTGNTTDKEESCIQQPKRSFISDMEHLDSYADIELCDSTAYAFIVDSEIQHPEIVLAQMKIESGNYQSGIAKKNNNYFGMRHPAQRLTVSLGQKNGYARYRNWAYSVIDYGLWQRQYAWDLTEEQYLAKLGKTYAEDPNYTDKVKKLSKNLAEQNFCLIFVPSE